MATNPKGPKKNTETSEKISQEYFYLKSVYPNVKNYNESTPPYYEMISEKEFDPGNMQSF